MYPSSVSHIRSDRVQVDAEFGSFYAGTQFRVFKEITLTTGSSLYVQFTRAVDLIIRDFKLQVNTGEMRCEIYRGATPSGSFNSPWLIIPKNEMTDRPAPIYTTQCAIASGGTFTGGTMYDLMHVKTAGATGQAYTVGQHIESKLAAPANATGYYKFTNPGNSDTTGIFSMWWEELPIK